MSQSESLYKRVYKVVERIPAGKVATYGQIAKMSGKCTARQTGYAMAAVPDDLDVPWHRVINAQGKISARSDGEPDPYQYRALLAEGVLFSKTGRVDFKRYGWQPGFEDYFQEPEEPGMG
ncbi:MAG: methylated-DNA-protein-cysteine methyltransferase-like protein [Gammaproteobacteria bacterium]|jgi:methylated-DNA-protein-cysteine methyltransferase-like protein